MTHAEMETFFLAILSTLSCLTAELSKAGHLNAGNLIESIQRTASAARESGEPLQANYLHVISEFLLKTIPDAPSVPSQLPRR